MARSWGPRGMPQYLVRNGCRIAYTKVPAQWGRHGDIVYLPGKTGGGCC